MSIVSLRKLTAAEQASESVVQTSAAAAAAVGTLATAAAAAAAVLASPCCCAVVVCPRLSELSLAELLVDVLPTYAPTQSAAKRAVRHRRVALASQPEALLRWRGSVAAGERVVLRPLLAQKLQPLEDARALASTLIVLWEDPLWLCVLKPAGMAVLKGRTSLANAVRGLQAIREEGVADKAPPFTVAYDGDARVGGAWLVAKTALAALALLDGHGG